MALILVLDHEEDACQLMRRILSGAGHDIEAFTSEPAAMEWLRSNNPELALLEFNNRKCGGPGILGYIRRTRPEIKTLLITGRSSPEFEKKAGELGISDYLIKPLEIEEIEENIAKALGNL